MRAVESTIEIRGLIIPDVAVIAELAVRNRAASLVNPGSPAWGVMQDGCMESHPTFDGIGYIAFTVRDVRRSAEWYQRVLGLTLERENIGGAAWPSDLDEVLLRHKAGGLAIGLVQHPTNDGEPFDERRVGLDHVEFEVASLDELRAWEERLNEHGVSNSGIKGHILTFRDPDNVQLEFFCSERADDSRRAAQPDRDVISDRHRDAPILEFDSAIEAFIEPSAAARSILGLPEAAVICFFQEVIAEACGSGRAQIVADLDWEHSTGDQHLYDLQLGDGRHIAVFHPGVGAALAAGIFEDVIAYGCKRFVACGGAGALSPELALGHVIVPTAAIRDEGTSYHYLPAARQVDADPLSLAVAVSILERHGVPYTIGKTWTTDAPYRETNSRIARRKAEGCIVVEMEAAALLAVAMHRDVKFVQYLYAGDDVSGAAWDHRNWKTTTLRRDLFHLAIEAALAL